MKVWPGIRFGRRLLAAAAAVVTLAGLGVTTAAPPTSAATASAASTSVSLGPYPVLPTYSLGAVPSSVQNWEASAQAQVAALRGVNNGLRNQLWSRGEIQADMYAQLLHMATESSPSSSDTAVMNWFAQQLTARQEKLAKEALSLYNTWHSDPCGFEPPVAAGYLLPVPKDYQTSYGQSVATICETIEYDPSSCVLSGACTPNPPSATEFTDWAAIYIQQQNIVSWGNELLHSPSASAAGAPRTVLDAQQQAQAEYEGSFATVGQGISFLAAAGSALGGVTTSSPAKSDFSAGWDAVAEYLRDEGEHELTHTVIDALQTVFESLGPADGTPADFLESQLFHDLLGQVTLDSAEVDWFAVFGVGLTAAVVIAYETFQTVINADVPTQLQDAVTTYQSTANLGSLAKTSAGKQLILASLIDMSLPAFTLDRAAYQYSVNPAQRGPVLASDPAFYVNGATTPSYTFTYSDWQTRQDETTSVDKGWFSQGPISSASGPYPYEYVPSINFTTGGCATSTQPCLPGPGENGVQNWKAWLDGNKFLAERISVSAGSGYVSAEVNAFCPGQSAPSGNVNYGEECVTSIPVTAAWTRNSAPPFAVNIESGDLVSIGGQVRKVGGVIDNSSGKPVAFTTTSPFGAVSSIAGDPVLILTTPDPTNCLTVSSLGSRVSGPDCVLSSKLTMLTSGGSTVETVALTPGGNGKANPELSVALESQVAPATGTPFYLTVSSKMSSFSGSLSVKDQNGHTCQLPVPVIGSQLTSPATCSITESTAGEYTFTATYSGDGHYLPESASFSVYVAAPHSTTTSLSVSVGAAKPSSSVTAAYGSPVTFNVTVTPPAISGPCVIGNVNVLDGPTVIGTIQLPGGLTQNGLCFNNPQSPGSGPVSGSYTTSSLSGTNKITAEYLGDGTFAASTSSAVTVTVSKAQTSMGAMTVSPSPAVYGKPLTLTVPVNAPAGEQVQFTDVDQSTGTKTVLGSGTIQNGAASLTVPTLPVGQHEIDASYPGDANYTSADTLLSFKVAPAPLTITASGGTQVYGGTPPAITPAYSGFVNGDTAASLTTAPTCVPGTQTFSAPGTYHSSCSGTVDPNYAFTYKTGTVTVSMATTTTSLASSVDPSMQGHTVTFTARVTPQYAGTPGGTVSFYDKTGAEAILLGTGTLAAGNGVSTATFSTSDLGLGQYAVTAVYSGSTDFTASTSPALTQYVDTDLSGYPTLPNGAYNLSNANLKGAYLPGFPLAGANLADSNLKYAIFAGADLSGADMTNSNFTGAVFTGADLSGANLSGSNLKGAAFAGADLSGANLSGVNLKGATGLTSANLSNVTWSATECPDGTNSSKDGGSCQGHL